MYLRITALALGMRPPREFSTNFPVCYMCSCDVVYKRGIFDAPTSVMFLNWLYICADFCGVSVPERPLTRCGYRMLVVVHDPTTFSDEQLLEAYGHMYGLHLLARMVDQLNAGGALALDARRRLRYGLGRIDVFQQLLKQGMTARYNKAHKRKGTLWQERYNSMMLPSDDAAVRVSAVTLTIMAEDEAGEPMPRKLQQAKAAAKAGESVTEEHDVAAVKADDVAPPTVMTGEQDAARADATITVSTDRGQADAAAPELADGAAPATAGAPAFELHDDGLPLTAKHDKSLDCWTGYWRAQIGDSRALRELARYFPPTEEYTTLERFEATKELVRWMMDNPRGNPQTALPARVLMIACGLVLDFFMTLRDLCYFSDLARGGYGRVVNLPSVFEGLFDGRGEPIERAKQAHKLKIHTKCGQQLMMLLRPGERY